MKYIKRLKEKLATLYIRYWLMSNTEDFTTPGFIITKFSGKNYELSLRDIFLPESILIEIENQIVKLYGKDGEKILYSAGKRGGYAYASLSNLTRRSQLSENEFENYVWDLLLFIGGTYSSDVSLEIDLNKKKIQEEFKDFIICESNGLGKVITEGGIAGIWAYLIEDNSVETLQYSCQGRGDDKCRILCQPYSQFESSPPFAITDLSPVTYSEEYSFFNQIRKTEYSTLSLNTLLESQLAKYDGGRVLFDDIRHFELDPHILFMLEHECMALPKGSDILFEIAFTAGKKIISTIKNPSIDFIMDYATALGWGDLLIIKTNQGYKLNLKYCPWTQYWKETPFTIFLGLISGMISTVDGTEFRLRNLESITLDEYLSIVATT